jgi:hypothetical protein
VSFSVSPDEAARIGSVRAVVMAVGDIPIWSMHAGRDELPADLVGDWTLDFTAECPPLQGAFEVAVGVENRDGVMMSVQRSGNTVRVRSGSEAGLLSVPYTVTTATEPVPATVAASAESGADRGRR